MLEGNYVEKDAKEVELSGKSFDDVKAFLRSFYPNMEHPLNESNVLQVYPLAHEYQMPLLQKCEEILLQNASIFGHGGRCPNLLIKYLCLAEKFNIEKVLTTAMETAAHTEFSSLLSDENIREYSLLSEKTRLQIAERRIELLEKKESSRMDKSRDFPKLLFGVRRSYCQ
ncbi:hypothetical protein FSP39_018505 [Pinctada imbricata]|uniref:BTB domain-containing protein n=1 Tax=Pinctada imbricata TaxID=66713 RepID=A0AA88YFA9_PINIB|nr:hypothetical protein FSP39_018505 [Pinctada imbricata]